MKRKSILGIILIVLLCSAQLLAFANPSISIGDVNHLHGSDAPPLMRVEPDSLIEDFFSYMQDYAAEHDGDVVTCFDEEVQAEIAAAIAESTAPGKEKVTLQDLHLDEYVPVCITDDCDLSCEACFKVGTVAEYSENDIVIVLLGIPYQDELVWRVIKSEVINNKLMLTLTADQLTAISQGTAVIEVLSNN